MHRHNKKRHESHRECSCVGRIEIEEVVCHRHKGCPKCGDQKKCRCMAALALLLLL